MTRRLSLAVVVFLVMLFVAACATTWVNASQFTPLVLGGTKITPPGNDVPKEITRFSGIWYGFWDNGRATTLVVKKVKPPKAEVIYSYGPLGKEKEGGFKSHQAIIESNKLTVSDSEEGITINHPRHACLSTGK